MAHLIDLVMKILILRSILLTGSNLLRKGLKASAKIVKFFFCCRADNHMYQFVLHRPSCFQHFQQLFLF